MKKSLKVMVLAAAAALCMTGCTSAQEAASSQAAPETSVQEDTGIDFIELHNETLEQFGEIVDTPYTFISSVDIDGDNQTKTVTVSAKTVEGASEEDAEHFAAAVLRHIAEAATSQYPDYDLGGPDGFGNFFDDYAIDLKILNADDSELYTLNVAAGDEIPLDPDIETYEEDWREYLDLYLQGQEDLDL